MTYYLDLTRGCPTVMTAEATAANPATQGGRSRAARPPPSATPTLSLTCFPLHVTLSRLTNVRHIAGVAASLALALSSCSDSERAVRGACDATRECSVFDGGPKSRGGRSSGAGGSSAGKS